ncbi:MAG: PQQ-binding-like beta-propeller repeat protein [Armatimonadota bacterium]
MAPSSPVVWIRAESTVDPTNVAYAVVFLGDGEKLTVVPNGVSVPLGGTVDFTAVWPNGSPAQVEWRIAEGPGSIAQGGRYSAPETYTGGSREVVVEALSADPLRPGVGSAVVQLEDVSVKISPSEAFVVAGGAVSFSAQVLGAVDQTVSWSILQGRGSIDAGGVYSSPRQASDGEFAVVRAVSRADPSRTADVKISIHPVSVKITPAKAQVHLGNAVAFSADVLAGADRSVRWQIVSGPGELDQSGVYRAPEAASIFKAVIRAVSNQDPSRYAEAEIEILPRASVSVTPPSARIRMGTRIQLKAIVQGSSDPRVLWSIREGPGWVSDDGVYTAPAEVQQPTKAVVVAQSAADAKAFASAEITILPPVRVQLSAPKRVRETTSAVLTAVVLNAVSNADVTWSISGAPSDSLRAVGIGQAVFTAPDVEKPATVVITAASVEDPSASASQSIIIFTPIGFAWVHPKPDTAMPGDTVELLVEVDANVVGVAKGGIKASAPPGAQGFEFEVGVNAQAPPRPGPLVQNASYAARSSSPSSEAELSLLSMREEASGPGVLAVFPLKVLETALPGQYDFRLTLDLYDADGNRIEISTGSSPLTILPPEAVVQAPNIRAAPGETAAVPLYVNRWAGRPSYPVVGLSTVGPSGAPLLRVSKLEPGDLFPLETKVYDLGGGRFVILGEAEQAPGTIAVAWVEVPKDAPLNSQYRLVPYTAVSTGGASFSFDSREGTLAVREPISVQVLPRRVIVRRNSEVFFKAEVSNADDPGVIWSIEQKDGEDLGTIDETGRYLAPLSRPRSQTAVVVAVSREDSRRRGQAVVEFAPDVLVRIQPEKPAVNVGGKLELKAVLENILPGEENSVEWSLDENSPGSIQQIDELTVVYLAPQTLTTPAEAVLRARSLADPFSSAEVSVQIRELSVKVEGPPHPLRAGEQWQMKAAVENGTTGLVAWALRQGPGEVNSETGLYRAPEALQQAEWVVIRAVSLEDQTKFGEVRFLVQPIPVVVIHPPKPVPVGGKTRLTAEVRYAADPTVKWKLIGGPGAVDEETGEYTAVPPMSTPARAVVRAVSAEYPKAHADAVIEIPRLSVSVEPGKAQVRAGENQKFQAAVRNGTSGEVSWGVVTGPGDISPDGVFSAPSDLREPAVAVVAAVSAEDPSASAQAVVAILPKASVTVRPSYAEVHVGKTILFSAELRYLGGGVKWEVVEGPGTVNESGLYTAPQSLPNPDVPASAVIRAASLEDPSVFSEARVTIRQVRVEAVKNEYEVPVGGSVRIEARVWGAEQLGVIWKILEGPGSIDAQTGLYKAPDVAETPVLVKVRAESEEDIRAFADVLIRIPAVQVSVSAEKTTIRAGDSSAVNVEVRGGTKNTASWTLLGPGRLEGKVYTAPSEIYEPAKVILKAVSTEDPTKTAEVLLTVLPRIRVVAEPAEVTVPVGGTVRLQAKALYSEAPVRWLLVSGPGALEADTGVYRALPPIKTPTAALVRAVSTEDEKAFADVKITVPAVKVAVIPSKVRLKSGGSAQFSAAVENCTDPSVRWFVEGAGEIDQSGEYRAPKELNASAQATVRAVSICDSGAFGEALVEIVGPISVRITPKEARLDPAQSVQLRAQVTNAENPAVKWVLLSGEGSLSEDGVYTAPPEVPSPFTALIKAVSVEDEAAFDTAAVAVSGTPYLRLLPKEAQIELGGSVVFSAAAVNLEQPNPDLLWEVIEGPGTIDQNGVYTAPETAVTPAESVVRVSLKLRPQVSDTAVVKIPAVSVFITEAPAVLSEGERVVLNAEVAGARNKSVQWSILSGPGDISPEGIYTAPGELPSDSEAVLKATSAADPSKFAAVRIQLVRMILTVEPAEAVVPAGESLQLYAHLSGTSDTRVTWVVEGGEDYGTVDANGLYTAPPVPPPKGTAEVKAVSAANPAKFATAKLTIVPRQTAFGAPWPMFLHDPQHTGRSSVPGPADPVAKWKIPLSTSLSSPAVAGDGTMFIGTRDKSLAAVRPSGELVWTLSDTEGKKGWVRSSPAVAEVRTSQGEVESVVYAVCQPSSLVAVSKAGKLLWEAHLAADGGGYPSPVVRPDGTICAADGSELAAFTPDGTELWRVKLGGATVSSPASAQDGTVYIGCDDGALYAVSPDGELLWRFWTQAGIRSSPTVGADGTVYFGSADGFAYAVAPNGKELWRFFVGGEIAAAPAVGADGSVYFASTSGNLYALSPFGEKLWQFRAESPLLVAPVLDSAGMVYAAAGDGTLYCIKPNGAVLWTYRTGGPLNSSPVIAGPGLMYLPSEDGFVHVLATRGDVNGDGRVTTADAVAALRIALGIAKPLPGQLEVADVSPLGEPPGDGKITVQDATVVLRRAVGLGPAP